MTRRTPTPKQQVSPSIKRLVRRRPSAYATWAVAGLMSMAAVAKPDLTTPADLSVLQQADSGYHFVSRDFVQAAPDVSSGHDARLSALAQPRHYRVWLGIPDNARAKDAAHRQEALYLLDGNAAIDTLSKADHPLLPQLAGGRAPVLVFLGYQTPYRFDVEARAYDYTPPLSYRLSNSDTNHPKYQSAFREQGRDRLNGGAEGFYTLIKEEVKPWVYQQLGYQPSREGLWGHSFGGLFVLHNLFHHPEAFEYYYSADPSLWWQDKAILDDWQAYQARPAVDNPNAADIAKLRLTFSASTKAAVSAGKSAPESKAPSKADKPQFAKALCAYFGDRCRYTFYQQSHGALFGTALMDMLAGYVDHANKASNDHDAPPPREYGHS